MNSFIHVHQRNSNESLAFIMFVRKSPFKKLQSSKTLQSMPWFRVRLLLNGWAIAMTPQIPGESDSDSIFLPKLKIANLENIDLSPDKRNLMISIWLLLFFFILRPTSKINFSYRFSFFPRLIFPLLSFVLAFSPLVRNYFTILLSWRLSAFPSFLSSICFSIFDWTFF